MANGVMTDPRVRDVLRTRQRIEAMPPVSRLLPRPLLHVLANASDGLAIVELFTRRGFAAGALTSVDDLETLAHAGHMPAAVIVDLLRPDAQRAIDALGTRDPGPVVVGIVEACNLETPFTLDAAFIRPVDPARLFVSVVELLADRKKGRGRGNKRITGVVAMVDGNELFRAVTRELHVIMSPVCAGAALEYTLRELGVSTYAVNEAEIEALLASGRLATAIRAYSSVGLICATMARIRAVVLHH